MNGSPRWRPGTNCESALMDLHGLKLVQLVEGPGVVHLRFAR